MEACSLDSVLLSSGTCRTNTEGEKISRHRMTGGVGGGGPSSQIPTTEISGYMELEMCWIQDGPAETVRTTYVNMTSIPLE